MSSVNEIGAEISASGRFCFRVFIFSLLLLIAGAALAEYEISGFKLYDVSGDLTLGYTFDDRAVGSDFSESHLWREELWIRTRSYVYHPALLDMQISAGPLLVQERFNTGSSSASGSEAVLNYDANFSFLSRKNYPFTISLRRTHPDISTAQLGRFLSRSDVQEIRGALRPPLTPMYIVWDAGHVSKKGSGFGSTLDESIDRASLRGTLSYGERQSIGLSVNWNDRESASGSAGLPIQRSLNETLGAQLDAENVFGERQNILVSQNLRFFQQDTQTDQLREFDYLNYSGGLRWNFSGRAFYFANLTYFDEERTETWRRSSTAKLGGQIRANESLSVGGDVHTSNKRDPGFVLDRSGARLRGQYDVRLPVGLLIFSGTANLVRTDQQASSETASIVDEPHVLVGVTPDPLDREFILEETVVVTNSAQTQTFVEGFDYRLVTIGSTTTIERIATGSIFDGQRVLVSYEYQIGGTAEYDTLSGSLSADYSLDRFLSLFVRMDNLKNEIRSGLLTTPLNDLRRFEVGGRFEYPFESGWSLGGDYRYTDQDEDIAPFVRNSLEIFTQTGNYLGTKARLGVRLTTVDFEFSREDVDLVVLFANLSSRLPGGARLAYQINSSEDDGGSLRREDVRHSLQLDWRYRRMTFALRANYSDTAQDMSSREQTRVTVQILRTF